MLWIVLCVTLAVVESGDWSANAQKLFEEVYGKKLAAAKTPQAKALLARELLELAKKEADSDAKKIELQTAKRLAIDAESPALALDIVRALVEAFPETSLSQEELLERADMMWKEAEKRKGKDRLAWQLDAVSLWLSAPQQTGLLAKKWAYRLGSIVGAVTLEAKSARLTGPVNYVADVDSIGDWIDPDAFVEWDAWLEQGVYDVQITYAYGYPRCSGVTGVAFLVDGKAVTRPLRFAVQPTGPGFVFRTVDIGSVRLVRSGLYTIRFFVITKEPSAAHVIQLRSVTLATHSAE